THAAHGKIDWFRNNKLIKEEGYVTELLGNDAVRLIARHDTKTPLFLYLTFTAPHAPYQAPQAYIDQYKQVGDVSRRAYAAMITAMDEQMGRVVKALDARRRQAVSANGNRLRHRTVSGCHTGRRLEARLEINAPVENRIVQPRARPGRDDQPRGQECAEGCRTSKADRSAGRGSSATAASS